MDHFIDIYLNKADKYHQMITPEDVDGNLLPALERVFRGLEGHATVVKAYLHPDGHTQFVPGYVRHLAKFDEQWLPERLAVAGDYLVAPTVEGAVVSGERAALRLHRMLRSQEV